MIRNCTVVLALALLAVGCDAPSEAPRAALPVVVDGGAVTSVTTDLGYTVEVTSARVALRDVVFTVAGEVHTASILERVAELLVPKAHAHPGHYQGGEVTGELLGAFVVDWPADHDRELGVAELIAADYDAANFTFGRGDAEQLGADDPLVGHTAHLSGVATRGGQTVAFTIVVDAPEARELVGAPCEVSVSGSTSGALLFKLHTKDALEGDTLFDTIDFIALDSDGDGDVAIAPDVAEVEDAYNAFRRVFLTHDHYSFDHEP